MVVVNSNKTIITDKLDECPHKTNVFVAYDVYFFHLWT